VNKVQRHLSCLSDVRGGSFISLHSTFMSTDPNDPAVKAAEERRKKEAGKSDDKIGFGGSLTDIGDKDAEGVGEGK